MSPRIPREMRYILMQAPGPAQMLQPSRMPTPRPGHGEVLIQVAAAGVNRPDVLQRLGSYPPPPGASDVLGLEVAGTVVATGDGVDWPTVGEKVCALVASGGYAEYCLAPAPQCLPIPAGLSLVEAAALPENYFTVWSNLFERGRLKRGETVLIHGGSSGIGTTSIQLAVQFGARVAITAGNAAKCQRCLELGAELAINYHSEDFVAAVHTWTQGRGVDVILDSIGGSYIERNFRALALEGRLIQIAFLEGSRVGGDLRQLMVRRLTWLGSTLRPQSIEAKGELARALREHVWPLLEARTIRPLIYREFPLAEAAAAHRLMEESTHIGKIMLVNEDS